MAAEIRADKLSLAIQTGFERLETFRAHRREAFEQYVGRHYYAANISNQRRSPINLVNRGVSVLVPYIALGHPKHHVRAKSPQFRGIANMLAAMLDGDALEMDRASISQRWILDALLSPTGIVRTGIRAGSEIMTVWDRDSDRGEFFIENIDFDDYFIDPAARSIKEAMFEGHRVRVVRELALDSDMFDQRAKRVIETMPSLNDGRVGVTNDGERVEDMTSWAGSEQGRFGLVDLIELNIGCIYLDGQTMCFMLPGDRRFAEEFLWLEEFQGPERGPYHHLQFLPVPNQPMGLPWVSVWREQAELMDKLSGALINQVTKTKRILLTGMGTSDEDLNAVAEAQDGEHVKVTNPQDFNAVDMGGYSAELERAAHLVMNWWSEQTGHLDVVGGDSGGADTATEYAGRAARAGLGIEHMRRIYREAESRVSGQLAWYRLTDPFNTWKVPYRLPGLGEITLVASPESREADFSDFMFSIRSTNSDPMNPDLRLKRLNEGIQTLMSGVQLHMATGGMFDAMRLAELLGDELEYEALDELVMTPESQAMGAMLAQAAQPPQPSTPVQGPRVGRVAVAGQDNGTMQGQVQSVAQEAVGDGRAA